MQFLTISLIALGAVLQPAAAKCYGSGDNWNNQGAAREWVRHACSDQGGMFTGFYDRLQSKEMCVEGNFFQVKNENGNQGFDLDNNDCIMRLYNEISCGKGGENHVAGWFFRGLVPQKSLF
ncbi:hypothetical protein PRZ48_012634 [Zasmidium cellare]|uniref:Uncharacterized protein n=1 Tax=Zasmidium cellare TaxID=395010 RepID=A0ABR0E5E7_ZASCE|nr:hypothetical protein PRZ48_012634 [Zasmidium cellare]